MKTCKTCNRYPPYVRFTARHVHCDSCMLASDPRKKACSLCENVKAIAYFGINSRGIVSSTCKTCDKKRAARKDPVVVAPSPDANLYNPFEWRTYVQPFPSLQI